MNQLTPGVRERTSRTFVRRVGQAHMPTPGGLLDMIAYAVEDAGVRLVPEQPHLALVNGQPAREAAPLVRVHSECLTGDLFGSLRCDCGPQLDAALRAIQGARSGVVVYLRQEGRGIGLVNKLAAYNLQDHGLDTIEANERLGLPVDNRDYGIAAGILLELGIQRVRLLTNNPGKVQQLEDHGIAVLERLPLEIPAGEYNRRYLRTKRDRLGHHLAASEDEYHA